MNKPVFLIGNAHIDPVWLWQWQDGYAEIKATYSAALDRIDEFPEFIFTSACASYYHWVEENAPELFQKIKQEVVAGRFALAGGFWVQPDCNIPSGESFCRHALYSQRYFKEKFGVTATTGYNVDSFGHNGMLPQIHKKAGMDSYIFMRPNDEEKALPSNLFRWKSPDGSEVVTFKIPFSYGDWFDCGDNKAYENLNPTIAKILETKQMAEEQKIPLMCFYGVGNHGGGPTIKTLNAIEELLQKETDVARYASPKHYFDEVMSQKEQLPLVQDDLQHHASGCYAAKASIKMLNRKAENRLLTAEKLMSFSYAVQKHHYDNDLLTRAWQKLMFNQFHDILAGCCIKEAYEDAHEAMGESLNIASELANAALQKISWNVDTTGGTNPVLSKENDWMIWEIENKGIPVIVFNPHSFPVKCPIKINKELRGATDGEGNPVPLQKIRGSQTNQKDIYNTLLFVELPPLGYATYWIFKEREFPVSEDFTSVLATDTLLENEYIRVEFSAQTGDVTAIINKENGKNILSEPTSNVIIDETDSDTWAHGIFEFSKEIGKFMEPTISLVEKGQLRSTIRVEQKYEDTILRQDYSLLAGRKQLDVSVQMDVRMHHKQIKMCFPLALKNAKPIYSMPYGFIEKEADGLEEPSQQWISATSESGEKFALINNGKYSFSMKGNTLRMLAIRTPGYADHFGERDMMMEYTDQGVSEFAYSILPCCDTYDQIVRAARVLNQPPQHIVETYHKGTLAPSATGIDISCPNVIAEVLKRSENNDGYILRLFEAQGMVSEKVKIKCLDRDIDCSFVPQEIKTIFIPDESSKPIKECMITEFFTL